MFVAFTSPCRPGMLHRSLSLSSARYPTATPTRLSYRAPSESSVNGDYSFRNHVLINVIAPRVPRCNWGEKWEKPPIAFLFWVVSLWVAFWLDWLHNSSVNLGRWRPGTVSSAIGKQTSVQQLHVRCYKGWNYQFKVSFVTSLWVPCTKNYPTLRKNYSKMSKIYTSLSKLGRLKKMNKSHIQCSVLAWGLSVNIQSV